MGKSWYRNKHWLWKESTTGPSVAPKANSFAEAAGRRGGSAAFISLFCFCTADVGGDPKVEDEVNGIGVVVFWLSQGARNENTSAFGNSASK